MGDLPQVHSRQPLSIPLFRRESVLPRIHSILLAIGQFTRTIVGCGISGCILNQTVVCSRFDDVILMFNASKSLSPIHDPPFSRNRFRRKLLGVGRTRTVAILPRAPPVAERRIKTRRGKHHDCRSNYSAIGLETEHRALNNYYNLFLTPSPPDDKRLARITIATAISHAASRNFARKKRYREALRTLISA